MNPGHINDQLDASKRDDNLTSSEQEIINNWLTQIHGQGQKK